MHSHKYMNVTNSDYQLGKQFMIGEIVKLSKG